GSTSLAMVTRQSLSAQTQVSATLGYAGAATIRVPAGTPPSAVQQAEQTATNSERMLQSARASMSADSATLANAQATVSAARAKEAVDCTGDNAAEDTPGSSSPSGEAASSDAPASSENVGVCSTDVQMLASDGQSTGSSASKVRSDRASVSSDQAALADAQGSARTGRFTPP